MLAAALNVSAMTWRTSPAATELETVVLDWFRQLLGLSQDFTGVVYDTASVAVLHALAAARENLGLEVAFTRSYAGAPRFRLCAFMHRTRRTVRSKKRPLPSALESRTCVVLRPTLITVYASQRSEAPSRRICAMDCFPWLLSLP